MVKIFLTLITMSLCTAAYAGPVLFSCERPAWEGHEACGDSGAYETYTFYTYAEAILEDQSAKKGAKGYLRPEHVFMKVGSCDRDAGRPAVGRFEVDGETMSLWLGDVRKGDGLIAEKIMLDMASLTAEISEAEQAGTLTCQLQIGAKVSDLQVYDELYDSRFKLPRNPFMYDPQRYPRD